MYTQTGVNINCLRSFICEILNYTLLSIKRSTTCLKTEIFLIYSKVNIHKW